MAKIKHMETNVSPGPISKGPVNNMMSCDKVGKTDTSTKGPVKK